MVPTAHRAQLLAPVALPSTGAVVLPGRHAAHVLVPPAAVLNRPAAHASQRVAPAAAPPVELPAGQAAQASAAAAGAKRPEAQASQLPLPASGWCVPGTQLTQPGCTSREPLNGALHRPAGHSAHWRFEVLVGARTSCSPSAHTSTKQHWRSERPSTGATHSYCRAGSAAPSKSHALADEHTVSRAAAQVRLMYCDSPQTRHGEQRSLPASAATETFATQAAHEVCAVRFWALPAAQGAQRGSGRLVFVVLSAACAEASAAAASKRSSKLPAPHCLHDAEPPPPPPALPLPLLLLLLLLLLPPAAAATKFAGIAPAGHAAHGTVAFGEKRRAAHGVQLEPFARCSVSVTEPAGHGAHAVESANDAPPGGAVPIASGAKATTTTTPADQRPAAHGAHATAFGAAACVPAPQSAQGVVAAGEKRPAAHAVQRSPPALPSVSVTAPGSHSRHEAPSASDAGR